MSCACKKTERLDKRLNNQTNQEPKTGIKKVLDTLKKSLFQFFLRLLMAAMYVALIPVIIIFLLFSILFRGDFNIKVPKSVVQTLKESQNT